ncbi:hypothetical protein JXA48_03670 [Candidatus Woesearchaeota archaeon]|nr:hypothetical protein [Candidatus Woesearchaeota archaeon]
MKNSLKLLLRVLLFIGLMSVALAVEQHNLTSFQNCSEYTFYVDVTGFGEIYQGAYELAGCELFSATETKHRWKCDCLESLNLTLKTLYALDNTYTISVLSVSKDVDYESIADYEQKKMLVKTFVIENKSQPKQNTTPTGAVIGTGTKIGILSFVVLVFVLMFVFFEHYMGGAPWQDKNTRAINLHKKGQHAFESSKLKKAKRYYKRASKLRK